MRKKARNSLIVIVVLVVILGVGFGVWKMFFAPILLAPILFGREVGQRKEFDIDSVKGYNIV